MKETEILRGLHKAQCHVKGTSFVKGKKGVDKVDAKLTRGEAVLPVKTVRTLGSKNIARLIAETNSGKAPKSGLRAGGHYATGVVPTPTDDALRSAQRLAGEASAVSPTAPAPAPNAAQVSNLGAQQGAPAVGQGGAPIAAEMPTQPPDTVRPLGARPTITGDALRAGANLRAAAPAQPSFTPPAAASAPAEAPGLFTKEGMVSRLRSLKAGAASLLPSGETAASAPKAPATGMQLVGQNLGRAVANSPFELTKAGTALPAANLAYEALTSQKKNAFLDDPDVPFADKARVMGRDYITHGAAAAGGAIGAAAGSGVASIPLALGGAYLGNKVGEMAASGIDDPLQNYTLKTLKTGQPAAPAEAQAAAPQAAPADLSATTMSGRFSAEGQGPAGTYSGKSGDARRAELMGLQKARDAKWHGPGEEPGHWRQGMMPDFGDMSTADLSAFRGQAANAGDWTGLLASRDAFRHSSKMDELNVGKNIQRTQMAVAARNKNYDERLAQLQALHMDFDPKDGKPVEKGENYTKAYNRLSGTLRAHNLDIADLSPTHIDMFADAHKNAKLDDDYNNSTFGKVVQTLHGQNPMTSRNVEDYAAKGRNPGALYSSTQRGRAGDIPDSVTRGGVFTVPSVQDEDSTDEDIKDAEAAAAQARSMKHARR